LSINVTVAFKLLSAGVTTLDAESAVCVAHDKKNAVPVAGCGCGSDQKE
jgi:hypothetical protein